LLVSFSLQVAFVIPKMFLVASLGHKVVLMDLGQKQEAHDPLEAALPYEEVEPCEVVEHASVAAVPFMEVVPLVAPSVVAVPFVVTIITDPH